MVDAIPVIDLSQNDEAAETRAFRAAYGEVGFAYVEGHGVPESVRKGVFDASAAFHAMPRAAKIAIELNACHRGFIAMGTSTDVNSDFAEVTKPNQSESFMMMREDAPDAPELARGDYLAGPNQWPELAGFREPVEAYHEAMLGLGARLMRIAALSVGAEADVLAEDFATPTSWLRLLYYPPAPPQREEDLYGSAPHTDFGCLTILAQDDAGGLEVLSPEGDWIAAPPREGAFIVNVGDMLHRWTNGRLRSTPHRVINASGRARYSCPFFYDPSVASVISPLSSCVEEGAKPRFEPINFGDFLRAELEAGYEHHAASSGEDES
ncbi:MAG: 2OG-Fe(II) oxygenase family protein [Pseudomonadota bacterium]